MMHYKKGKNVEEELSQEQIPIEVLPANFLWMHVKGGSEVKNLVDYAKKALEEGTHRSVVWSGSDGGVGKTISCAEIMKRHFELHQVTRICYRKVEEFWDPQQEGLEQIVAKRNIPCVHILMSLDEIDPSVAGYQHSKTQGGFWTEAGLSSSDGPRKRTKEGGDRKGNYFTGPQLKKKPNRHYEEGNGTPSNGAKKQQNNQGKGKPRGGGGGDGAAAAAAAGSSKYKGKQNKDGGNRRKPNDSEVGENGGGGGEGSSRQEGAGGRRDKKQPGQGRKDKQGGVERMETSDDTPPASKPSGKDDNAGGDAQ
ncbi:ribonuclease P protein subunit p25-like protein [Anopheles gambiae]|uniref:ribonuclease P protein subunit p25-like protein n=1 Tax=Anopheles gambiae TaxID=7165 RepID=UPI002AC9AB00|nr:ribonuclease P protein subunit p25-like protein [Anopheles gambiae]XP_061508924.1 ribonuclease P protein subunit p25-like protein [Anopheles gambiae]XP_308518.5 ribonuclease P protein subunit p25-like protein [Anopheles gambiae]